MAKLTDYQRNNPQPIDPKQYDLYALACLKQLYGVDFIDKLDQFHKLKDSNIQHIQKNRLQEIIISNLNETVKLQKQEIRRVRNIVAIFSVLYVMFVIYTNYLK